MRRVAILIAASPTAAFYSQVAALATSLRRLPWSRWTPSVHLYLGGEEEPSTLGRWRPYLTDVAIRWTSAAQFARDGDWAQSDDVFRFAPRDADVLLAMDADTLPVASLESLLDQVHDTGSIAGVIAHYPTATPAADSLRDGWARLANGLTTAALDFAYTHTLVDPAAPPEQRLTPFYVNFGVVAFPRATFDEVATRYLAIRPRLMGRLPDDDFSGQAALTLAIAAAGARALALPMRFNFPNDPRADERYPDELARVVVYHYLRTTHFDRHRIFVNAAEYHRFLELGLRGVDRSFQQAVRAVLGSGYPFAAAGVPAARHT